MMIAGAIRTKRKPTPDIIRHTSINGYSSPANSPVAVDMSQDIDTTTFGKQICAETVPGVDLHCVFGDILPTLHV